MIKLGQMVLKGVNCVHNNKIRSNGLERSQLGHTIKKIMSNGIEGSQLGTQYKDQVIWIEMSQLCTQ